MNKRPKFTENMKEKVYLYYGGKCFDCGKIGKGYWSEGSNIIRKGFHLNNLEIHHIIPLKNGGSHCFKNFILLCPDYHDYRHWRLKNALL